MRLTLIALLFPLTACDDYGSIPETPKPLEQPCQRPTELPNRGMAQAEVETAWRTDRLALLDCGERHKALIDFITTVREAGK